MKEYINVSNNKAYQLLNTGALVLISSVSKEGKHNIAPIAWQCPVDFDPVTRLLIVCDKVHKSLKNIEETKQFAVSIPHISQLKLVKELGSCSGHTVNKLQKFNINTFETEKINCLVPTDCIGYIECKLYNIIMDGSVGLIFGEVVFSKVTKEAYHGRLLSESEAGKTIHHLTSKVFITTSDEILQ